MGEKHAASGISAAGAAVLGLARAAGRRFTPGAPRSSPPRPSQIYGRMAGQVAARPGVWLTPRGVDILSQLG